MKLCKVCSSILDERSPQWRKQIYCSVKCRKKSHRKKVSENLRVLRKRSNLRQNDEILYLVKECRRAGTVQILYGHDLNSFIETMALIRERPKGEVELCHIAPVKGMHAIGLFHIRNLFYGGKYQNRKFGNRYFSGGLRLHKMYLNPRWKIVDGATNNDVINLIESYLKNIIPNYLKVAPVRKSSKVSLINKILEVDKCEKFDDLILRNRRNLDEIWRSLSHQSKVSWYVDEGSKYVAYLDSLSRFAGYGGVRGKILERLISIMLIAYMALERVVPSRTHNKDFYVKYENLIDVEYGQAVLKCPESWSTFKDYLYDIAFDALQGKKINHKLVRKDVFDKLDFPSKATLYYGYYEDTFR